MRRFGHILLILLLIGLPLVLSAANYDSYINGGTNPGKEFETLSNWSGHTPPFTNNGDTYNISYSTNIHVSGYVRLDGNLNLINWGNLYVDDNSILIINGDFDIGDCSDVYLGKNANLYIKGNLITHDVADNYWYVRFNQENNSNIVVEKDLVSYWSRREWSSWNQAYSYQYNANAIVRLKPSGNSDFYVFGTTSGPIYKDNGNSSQTKEVNAQSVIDDAETYELEENELSITIADIEHAITVEYDCETLNVSSGETYIVSGNEEYCFFELGLWCYVDN